MAAVARLTTFKANYIENNYTESVLYSRRVML